MTEWNWKHIDEAPRPWLPALVLALVTLAAYQSTWQAGFLWDDYRMLVENPAMLSVGGLRQIWSSLVASHFVPLTLTTFWVEYRLWGLHPFCYHAVNIGVHAANAVLLWMVLRRLNIPGAWLAAAVWALHPVNVETVAWVSELKNTQSQLFLLLAVLMFLRFEDGLRPRDYGVALACGAAAMLSKPSTVVLPGVLLLCAWWRRRRLTGQDCRRVVPFVLFAVLMSLVTILQQRGDIAEESASQYAVTAAQRVIRAGRAPWFYAGKVLWPVHLCFVYPRWQLAVNSVAAWLPLAGLALVAAALWAFRRERWARAAIFGLGFFVLALLPVVGVFDTYFFRYSFVADHFQYLACIGLISLVVSAGARICEQAGPRRGDWGAHAAAVVLLVLGLLTWAQGRIYENPENLWRDTLAKNPDCWLAHNNLGLLLENQGHVTEAEEQYRLALRIFPDEIKAHINLGNSLVHQDRLSEAIAQYQEALRIQPNHVRARINLANALLLEGAVSEAIADYHEALRLDPRSVEAHFNLAVALEQAGHQPEAIAQYEQTLALRPDFEKAQEALERLRPGQPSM
jgi:tetratricopeptide (TPR) repeat protein